MKRSIRDLAQTSHENERALNGQRALVRVDFNCPIKDGAVSDNTRIRAALPTIAFLRNQGARVILMSHLGRPKGGPDPAFSMRPVVHELEKLLGAPVEFLADPLSDQAVHATKHLPRGGVAVLENTRFFPERRRTMRRSRSRSRAWATFTSTTPSARRTVRTRARRPSHGS
jgi:3-phosphoglycerate kinase